jgi:FkbM family methyltransferase
MKFSWVPFQDQIGKLLKTILPKGMIVPILQGKLRGKKWIIGSGNVECALGSYEHEKRILFEKEVSKSSVVYDIGAHVGFYTLLASELVGESGKVIAFEPVPRNLNYLKRHLEINRCNNVKVIEAAVSDKSGISHFNEGPNSSMGHLSEDGSLTVNSISIDELVENDKIPTPDYIKIDIEGAELLALKGAKSTLSNYNPTIFLATHSHRVPNVHIDCCNFLASLGYKLKPIVGDDLYATREIFAYKDDNCTRRR